MHTAARLAPALALLLAAGPALAGPLNPPAGPITPSFKTLTEVEPRTAIAQPAAPANGSVMINIAQSGSYYLTSNITAPAGFQGSAIFIGADNVTLDLNGFSIIGNGLGNSVSSGITNNATVGKRLLVRNGVLRDWAGSGLDVAASAVHLTDLRAAGNGVCGFKTGPAAVIDRCSAESNTEDGFAPGLGCTLSNCTSDTNGIAGYRTAAGATLTACVARFNTGTGFVSFFGATFDTCIARQNSGGGFSVDAGGSLHGCVADGNGSFGFALLNRCQAVDCTATSTSGATADGFLCPAAGDSCSLTNCISTGNGRDGFSLSNNCTATGCVARQNAGSDFKGLTGNTFLNCTGAGSPAAVAPNSAFTVSGARNRFEACQALRHAKGFEATTTGNIYLRNTASGNTDAYGQVAAGNFIGTIITTAAAFGSNTNANANISY